MGNLDTLPLSDARDDPSARKPAGAVREDVAREGVTGEFRSAAHFEHRVDHEQYPDRDDAPAEHDRRPDRDDAPDDEGRLDHATPGAWVQRPPFQTGDVQARGGFGDDASDLRRR